MKLMFKKFLLKALILIVSTYIVYTSYQAYLKPVQEPIRIIQQHEQISNKSEYIISKEAVMSKLQSKSQIISMQQNIENEYTKVDDSFFGERRTELHIEGTYIFGLETSHIKVTHIDNESGIVYVKLPKPILINLDIPYDQVGFDKTKGWLRMSMSKEDEKRFYKSVVKDIENNLVKNEEVSHQADLFNQEAVRDILKLIPNVKDVVFE